MGSDSETESRSIKERRKLMALAPIAKPLAGKKLRKRTLKLVRRASESKCLKRGVKEVVKSIRRGQKGIMAGPGRGYSRGRQQASLDDTHLHFSILHDESEDLDETQLSESTEQTSAQPEPVQPEVMAPQHHPPEGTQQRCAVRGPSRGLVLEKYVYTYNEKPKVQIFRDHPAGTNASIVANEISLYMWNHFSWAVDSFKHVAPRYRDALVSHIKDNINFEDCTDEQVTACILKMAANRYRYRRCRLHKYCNELQAKGIDPVTQPYRNWAGSGDDWRWLCEHFRSERRSEVNKVNSSKIDSIHTQGSASFAQEMKRMGLSGIDVYGKFYQNKSDEFVTEEARQRYEKMLQLREQMAREVGSNSDVGSQSVCSMTDDAILDTVLEQQLGSGHSMRSKKFRSSSSVRSDDASVPEAVRTSMSMMQDQITYWMNRNQTLERIVAAMAGQLGIDASELAPLQPHDVASAQPSRHTSGQGSTSGGGNEANDSDDT
ncbi:uncharacterized protein [Elaeis guineensis]|uniref:uncharacterized protein isoform X3 n=1 Tax=Elaeis guineensis var. tenera TaxID=51953 RepID=UPI003C6CF797